MKEKHVLIIGEHPMINNLCSQYHDAGYTITICPDVACVETCSFDELFIISSKGDSTAIDWLRKTAKQLPIPSSPSERILCHLVLEDIMSIRQLEASSTYNEVKNIFLLYPITFSDLWARNKIVAACESTPITYHSDCIRHIVILGMNERAESVAINAALIAHYPNFIRNQKLRTHITIIDEKIDSTLPDFIGRYKSLFDNSYYSVKDYSSTSGTAIVREHKPDYLSVFEEDFVDVEWEFIKADTTEPSVQNLLKQWEKDDSRVIHVISCYEEPDCIDYDINVPLLKVAQVINYLYDYIYSRSDEQEIINALKSESITLEDINVSSIYFPSLTSLYSSLFHAMAIPSEIQSLGYEADNWDATLKMTDEELTILSTIEHNRWTVATLILGFCPPNKKQREAIANNIKAHTHHDDGMSYESIDDLKKKLRDQHKVHFDLCPYNSLNIDYTGKNVKLYDTAISLGIPLMGKAIK